MHVVVVGNRFPWPLRDGGAQATYGMLQSLCRTGVEVTYFSFNTEKHWVNETVLAKEFDFISYRAIPKKTTATAVGAFINLWSKKSYHVTRYYDEYGSTTLKKLLQEIDNPVVWVEGLYSIPLVEPLLTWIKENGISLVYRSHNVEHQIWERVALASRHPIKKWYLKIQSFRLRKYEEKAWGWVDAILPITAADQHAMEIALKSKTRLSAHTDYKGRIQLYQPGFWDISSKIEMVNMQWNEADIPIHKNRCFHIGSMEWEANKQSVQWFLRECWPRILEKNPKAEFHLAGKGLVKDDLTYSGAGVFVHGEVESSEEFMMEHGIAVVPLLSGSGIRMKILEAMLYGCPVVTTNIGMQGLSVTPGVELRVADSASSFADEVVTLMGDGSLVNLQRKASWEFLGKYHNESENIQRVLGMISKGLNPLRN